MTVDPKTPLTFFVDESIFPFKDIESIKKGLESNNDEEKIEGMENLLVKIVSDAIESHKAHSLLMHVIRFVMPTKNKKLKKLALIFLENVQKYDSDGILKHEMILVW